MGSACHQCLQDTPPCQLHASESATRVTKHIKTSYSYQHISYFVTNQAIMRTRLDILIIFAERLTAVLDNGFIRELGSRDKAKLEERLSMISGKVQFQQTGDYVNIIDPFTSKCEVGNLLIVRIPIFEEKYSNIRQTMEESFDQISQKCEDFFTPTVGLIQADSRLGYSSIQFQKAVIKYLAALYTNKRKGTFVYFTYTEQQIQNFINAIINPENSFTQNSANSSNYF